MFYLFVMGFGEVNGESLWVDWMCVLFVIFKVLFYFYILFCKMMCWYCGCNMIIFNKLECIECYLDVLKDEMCYWVVLLLVDVQIYYIYFGGGLLDMLSLVQFSDFMQEICDVFFLVIDVEIVVEFDLCGIIWVLVM